MGRITLDLLRKRCEHNDGLIYNLEELSMHQDHLEEIENIDKWCKELKILYLQGNTIKKIENLNRLKSLEYLNLALNNIERIENLHRCESLRKLDLTANFIGEITSVENLKHNILLEELYLTGNPCANFENYREYIAVVLPQLKLLDGQEISRTQRLQAQNEFAEIFKIIEKQERNCLIEREQQRAKNEECLSISQEKGDSSLEDKLSQVTWSPEYRRQMAQSKEEVNNSKAESKKLDTNKCEKAPVKLFDDSGNPRSVNQLKTVYNLEDRNEHICLDIPIYRYLDTSLIDTQIEPSFVRITIKGKILQIPLPNEISPDRSTAQRSSTTGKLRLILPYSGECINTNKNRTEEMNNAHSKYEAGKEHEKADNFLDVRPDRSLLASLCVEKSPVKRKDLCSQVPNELMRPNSPGFRDDFDVPPLE